VNAADDRLIAEVEGDVEPEDKVLVIKRIRVRYLLRAPEEQRETIERVHGVHAKFCPVYRSLCDSIDITTELELLPE
jgi:uncharacterized OsmC-like protein